MDKITLDLINIYSSKVRKTLNSMIEEINEDFTGWCELTSMMMYRIIKENFPNIKENKIVEGRFKNEGHYWNIIDDVIVDLTIDQFGRYKIGIINKRWLKNYKIIKVKNYSDFDFNNMTDEFIDFIQII
ncbi:TPA: hypothetical protein N2D16_002872 [Clostridium botulinum]|nr:hypothetical protein [Clostridium botulinum]